MFRSRRRELNLSQYFVAKASGVAQVKISLAERGLVNLNEWEKSRISEVLGIPVPELFSVTGERALYRELRRFITLEEKGWLIDVGHDPELYKRRLEDLARKYAVALGTQ